MRKKRSMRRGREMKQNEANISSQGGYLHFIKDPTMLVTLITLLGYVSAYFYKTSYLDFFGVPEDFVDIDITSLILSGAIIFSVVLGGILLYGVYRKTFKKDIDKLKQSKYIKIFSGIKELLVICFLISMLWLLLSLPVHYGTKMAKSEKVFWVFEKGKQDYIVIGSNKDMFIIAPFHYKDANKKQIIIKRTYELIDKKSGTVGDRELVSKEFSKIGFE